MLRSTCFSRSYPDCSPLRARSASTAASVVVVSRTRSPVARIFRSVLVHFGLGKHVEHVPLRLEAGLGDVSEVLAVDLQRLGYVASELKPVEVVPVDEFAQLHMTATP